MGYLIIIFVITNKESINILVGFFFSEIDCDTAVLITANWKPRFWYVKVDLTIAICNWNILNIVSLREEITWLNVIEYHSLSFSKCFDFFKANQTMHCVLKTKKIFLRLFVSSFFLC